jgi:hypothetical protein
MAVDDNIHSELNVIPAEAGIQGLVDSCSLLGVRDRFRRSDMGDMVTIV